MKIKASIANSLLCVAIVTVIVFPLTLFINPDAVFSLLYWIGMGTLFIVGGIYGWRETSRTK